MQWLMLRDQHRPKSGGGGFTAGPWGEVEECPNESTVVETGSSPLPYS